MNEIQMPPNPKFSMILDELRKLIEAAPEKLSLRAVVSFFGPKGHVLLSLFFSLPFLQPVPIPGLSTLLGCCTFMFGLLMFLNRPPWIPNWIARREVEKKFLLRMTIAMEALIKKIEHVVRPRGQTYFKRRGVHAIHGLLLAYHAFLLALPLPIPTSNLVPALVLILISLGTLEEDVGVIIAGYVMVLVNVAYFGALVASPYFIKNLFT